jgi:hypothetical protein
MTTILASSRIGEHLTSQCGQAEDVVEFAIGEQPGIGGDDRAAKLQDQAAVKIEPESTPAISRSMREIGSERVELKWGRNSTIARCSWC